MTQGVFVENLTEETTSCAEEAESVMARGALNRRVGETAMNRESSRSHSVFTLHLETEVRIVAEVTPHHNVYAGRCIDSQRIMSGIGHRVKRKHAAASPPHSEPRAKSSQNLNSFSYVSVIHVHICSGNGG